MHILSSCLFVDMRDKFCEKDKRPVPSKPSLGKGGMTNIQYKLKWYYFSTTEMPRFGSKHHRDSLTSWFACMCASILNAANLGFSVSFGVMLPALTKEFHEGRQQTGESHFESGVI